MAYYYLGMPTRQAILHAPSGRQEDGIAQHPDAEGGKPHTCGRWLQSNAMERNCVMGAANAAMRISTSAV